MKQIIKYLIWRVAPLRKIVYEWGWGVRIPIGQVLLNYLFMGIFRQNKGCWYPVHYTSKIALPAKLKINGKPFSILVSLAISGGCYIQAGNGIEIGEGTIWAPNVVIVSANHDMSTFDKAWLPGPPVKIGRNCWIGANAVILPGVILGDNVVVGAGSVVTHSYPEGNITVAGNPASQVTRR